MAQQIRLHINDYNNLYHYALQQENFVMKLLVELLRRAVFVEDESVDKLPVLKSSVVAVTE